MENKICERCNYTPIDSDVETNVITNANKNELWCDACMKLYKNELKEQAGTGNMQNNLVQQKDFKFSIELKESAKKEKYIGAIKVRADTIEELEQGIKEAKRVVEGEWG